MRSLIVEDAVASRKFLADFLSQLGQVVEVTNGLDAVDAVEGALDNQDPYDLICMDITMPKLDGQSALERIREIESSRSIQYSDGAKVIMMSSHGDSENVLTAFRLQCEGYLRKPVDLKKLEDLLRELNLP